MPPGLSQALAERVTGLVYYPVRGGGGGEIRTGEGLSRTSSGMVIVNLASGAAVGEVRSAAVARLGCHCM